MTAPPTARSAPFIADRQPYSSTACSVSGTAAGGWYAPLAVQVGDLKFLQPRDFDSFELPIIQRRKLAACIDGLRSNAHKEL